MMRGPDVVGSHFATSYCYALKAGRTKGELCFFPYCSVGTGERSRPIVPRNKVAVGLISRPCRYAGRRRPPPPLRIIQSHIATKKKNIAQPTQSGDESGAAVCNPSAHTRTHQHTNTHTCTASSWELSVSARNQ